ncbi:hypothetical protein PV328_006618 [Microctonus aethiopoides]|uniref:Transmembrane protein 267 n=1 Tax=Microctonus aethiopoides TaxID=144406 RepID=A0AA39FQ40_9HYME|nr:hypothetical protein PV328_006618 [Microctonus aethiopoides]
MLNKIIQVISPFLIGIISITGDTIIKNSDDIVIRAICDNLTHGLVAGISWLLITVINQHSIIKNIPSIALCTAMSSLIDVDHFIEAQSWRLNAATNLERRPILHCTTIPILLWSLLQHISKIYESTKLSNFSWILLISFLSHHIRDATRRGLWLAPFGSTKPIPYYLYIITDMILPHTVFFLMNLSTNKITTHQDTLSIV